MNELKRIALNAGRPLLKVQDELIRSPAIIKAVFGGWRSGKTRGCALTFLVNCFANPWREEYGDDNPFSIVIGITHKVLKDSAYRELRSVLPRELVIDERKSPDWELMLANGHVIKFRTVKGAMEGASACGVWLDEAHKLPSEEIYLNYQMRASDALGKRFLVLVSGLPENGWLQATFDGKDDDPNRMLCFARTQDNHYNPPHVIAQFRKSVSRRAAMKYLDGRWMPRENTVYYEYSQSIHLKPWPGDKTQVTHIGVDIGNQGAVVFVQERDCTIVTPEGRHVMAKGLHVVDEMLPDEMSTRQAMREVKQRGWNINIAQSIIFVDPTTRRDEYDAIREVFGDIRIIRKHRGDVAEATEYGHACVNAALMDADGNTRLTFYDGLPRTERSLLTVLPKFHRGPNGKPHRDDTVDHVLDAMRYPVAHFLPIHGRAGA